MRITIANDGYRNCGGSLQFIKYANQMVALGHQVTLAYQYGYAFDLIPVHADLLYAPAMSADQLPDADIIMHSSWFMAERMVGLPESKGVPFSNILGFEQWAGPNEDIIKCWRMPMYKIVPSAYLQEQLWLHSGHMWPVIPFGLDFDAFYQEDEKHAPTPENQVVGALYNTSPNKRMPDLVPALRQLRKERPDLRIELFGFDSKPDLGFSFDYLHQPDTDQLRAMLNRCHVWLAMSDQEGLHVPPMEAMACGAVPVSSDIGGTRDYCLHRFNGLRVPLGDSKRAAKAVSTVLDDPALWRKYSDRSREMILAMGSEEDNVRVMVRAFEDALADREKGCSAFFNFDTAYRSTVATMQVYMQQAEKMIESGEDAQARSLARGVVRTLEQQAHNSSGERHLSLHGDLYGHALAMSLSGQPLVEVRDDLEKAALYAPFVTDIYTQADMGMGKGLAKLHDNPAKFDGHIRAYPTLACNLKCPHCVNRHVPTPAKGESRLTWQQWAELFNREKRHVVLTGGEPFLFSGLTDLVNAIEEPLMVRIYSNFSLDVSDKIAAITRPCIFYISWHAGQNVDREIFLNNIRAVRENPHTALDAHCVNTAETTDELQKDCAFFEKQGLHLPQDEDQRGFIGANPGNAEPAWCARRIYLLSPEGTRYQCVSKLIRRVDPLEDATKQPLAGDRLLTLCADWGICAPCDGLGESVVHVLREK